MPLLHFHKFHRDSDTKDRMKSTRRILPSLSSLFLFLRRNTTKKSHPGRHPKKRSPSIESRKATPAVRIVCETGVSSLFPLSLFFLFLPLSCPRRARLRAISLQIGEGKTLIFIPSKCVISPARLEDSVPLPLLPFPWSRARIQTHIHTREWN